MRLHESLNYHITLKFERHIFACIRIQMSEQSINFKHKSCNFENDLT